MKIAIIDFDGVIADSLTLQIKTVNKISKEFGYLRIKSNKEYRQYSMGEVIRHIKIPPEHLDTVIKKIRKESSKRYTSVPLKKGIKKVLLKLNKKYKLIIVSSNDRKIINEYLNKNKIRELFYEKIYISNDLFGKDKIIKDIIKEFKVSKKEILFIGDEQRDIVAGKKLKIKTIGVAWGYDSRARLAKANPDLLINKPQDLLLLVK